MDTETEDEPTAEMVAAGADVLAGWADPDGPAEELARELYRAMLRARRPPASGG